MALWPERYKPEDHMGGEHLGSLLDQLHLDHCIDQLRQSLMCSSDVSTVFLQWSPEEQKHVAMTSTTHTCRNFEKIQDWASNHGAKVKWDATMRVKDPLDELKS